MNVDINKLTPVEEREGFFFKRDDLFIVNNARGGKARSCYFLALQSGNRGLVTAGSRKSPQINIVSKVASILGKKSFAHCPCGELGDTLLEAQEYGIEIIQHKAGYNSVIIKRAIDHSKKDDLFYIPFGMECKEATSQTRKQVENIPKNIKRIVVPVGSGMSLAGILCGLEDFGLKMPVLGIQVGADPTDRLRKYAPMFWRERTTLVKLEIDYHTTIEDHVFRGIDLDPIYEAKCIPFLEEGDLFWIVGNRNKGEK